MEREHDSETTRMLLARVQRQPTPPGAWPDLVEHIRPRLYGWCRRWGLQDADAHDAIQNVLLRLAEKLAGFRYDPSGSFWAWLKTLVGHAVSDLRQAARRAGQGTGSTWLIDSTVAHPERTFAEGYDWEMLEKAMQRVQGRVAPQTWHAFRLTALEGLSGAESARRIPMKTAQVFVARRRVQRMLRDEVARTNGAGAPRPRDNPLRTAG